jgi:hypothetical protein
MSCANANASETVTSLLDGRLNAVERTEALAHLELCGACNVRYQSARNLRQSLRELGSAPVPDALAARLRVLASLERERAMRRFDFAAFATHWIGRARLCFDNVMRPSLLPVAGGLLFALLTLAWAPTLPATPVAADSANDVPVTTFYDNPRSLRVQSVKDSGELVVALTIDARGRICDFSVIHGEMTPGLANMILLSRFSPATFFGRPTSGTVVFTFSQVHVRG